MPYPRRTEGTPVPPPPPPRTGTMPPLNEHGAPWAQQWILDQIRKANQ